MTKKESRGGMGFTLLAVGGVFLFNPVVALVDVLPDIIGYFLICLGLWRLSDLNDAFCDCLKYARKLLFVSGLQIVFWWFCNRYIPEMMKNPDLIMVPNEHPMSILAFSLGWAVLTCVFLIPMMRHLFLGFGTVALRSPDSAVAKLKGEEALWERMTKKSVRFAVIIPVMAVLPELTVLTSINLLSPAPTVNFDWGPFTPLMRGAAAIVAGIFGLVWLISYLRFFARVKKDSAFCNTISEQYRLEILPQKNWLFYRRMALGVYLMTVGLIFSANLQIDNRILLPSFVCAVLLGAGVAVLGRCGVRGRGFLYAVGAVLTVLSLLRGFYFSSYIKEHENLEDALYLPKAYEHYQMVRLFECLEAIALAIFLLLFFGVLLQLVRVLLRAQERSLFAKSKKKLMVRLAIASLLACGASVLEMVHSLFGLEIKFLWLISLAASTAVLLVSRSLLVEIRDEILSRAESDRLHKDHERREY